MDNLVGWGWVVLGECPGPAMPQLGQRHAASIYYSQDRSKTLLHDITLRFMASLSNLLIASICAISWG